MKKFMVIFIVLIIALTIGLGAYFLIGSQRLAMEEVLPDEALFYFHLSDTKGNWHKISTSDFAKKIKAINYELLMDKSNVPEMQQQMFEQIKNQIFSPTTAMYVEKFLGREVAIGIYPSTGNLVKLLMMRSPSQQKVLSQLFSNFFLVTRVPKDVQLAEVASRFGNPYGAEVEKITTNYKKHTIQTIILPDLELPLSFVRFKDLVVITVGEVAAQKSVDTVEGFHASLLEDEEYQDAKELFIPEADMHAYLSIENFYEFLKEKALEVARESELQKDKDNVFAFDDAKQQVDMVFKKFEGLRIGAFSMDTSSPISIEIKILLDQERLDPQMAAAYAQCDPQENQTLGFTQEDVLFYQWNNCLNLQYYWNEIQKEAMRLNRSLPSEDLSSAPANIPLEKIKELEAALGFSIQDDLIPSVGNEIGGFLTDIQSTGVFPIPKFTVFLKVKDAVRIEEIVSQLTNQPFLRRQKESYGGTEITFLNTPLGEMIQPGYCFLNDYLILSVSKQMIKEAIDTAAGKNNSLKANKDIQMLDKNWLGKNNFVQFMKPHKLVDSIKGVISLSTNLLEAESKKKKAFKTGSERRLKDVNAELDKARDAREEIKKEIITLKTDLKDQALDMLTQAEKERSLDAFKKQLSDTENEIEDLKLNRTELEKIIAGYDRYSTTSERRQLFINEIFYPLLDGLHSVETMGVRTTRTDDLMHTSIRIKMMGQEK